MHRNTPLVDIFYLNEIQTAMHAPNSIPTKQLEMNNKLQGPGKAIIIGYKHVHHTNTEPFQCYLESNGKAHTMTTFTPTKQRLYMQAIGNKMAHRNEGKAYMYGNYINALAILKL